MLCIVSWIAILYRELFLKKLRIWLGCKDRNTVTTPKCEDTKTKSTFHRRVWQRLSLFTCLGFIRRSAVCSNKLKLFTLSMDAFITTWRYVVTGNRKSCHAPKCYNWTPRSIDKLRARIASRKFVVIISSHHYCSFHTKKIQFFQLFLLLGTVFLIATWVIFSFFNNCLS